MSDQLLETASRHPWSISTAADKLWIGFLENAVRGGWGPAVSLAQKAILSTFRRIAVGRLTVVAANGDVHIFPQNASNESTQGPNAHLRVRNDSFWIRLCLMGDLGFSEAYMFGDVDCEDLVALFKVFIANKDHLSNMDSKFSYLFRLPQKITSYRFLNTISNARGNVSAHYDLSNDMFYAFLGEDMTYSCAIFDKLDADLVGNTRHASNNVPEDMNIAHLSTPSLVQKDKSGLRGDEGLKDELHDAQLRKVDHIIQKLHIPFDRPSRILEIGSGWGTMAIRIAEMYPLATVDTITLSVQQQALIKERLDAHATSVADRISVHLTDYRSMPLEWKGSFDRVVSVELIENVGYEFMGTYWGVVDWALKDTEAAGVVQCITLPEARLERYLNEVDFIRKWVLFPGGSLPTLSLLTSTINTGSKGRLVVDSVSNVGPHYARTLREWRSRFEDNFEIVIKTSLQKEYPTVMGGCKGSICECQGNQGECAESVKSEKEMEVFRRKWLYYFCYSEAGFTTRTLGDHIITFTREGFEGYGCNVYM